MHSLPFLGIFVTCFAIPLGIILLFSVMPANTFSILQIPTLENYAKIFKGTYYTSLLASMGLAALTVILLLVICYPLAFAMVRVFKGFASFVSIAVVLSLFVSENIRLYGWVLSLMKRGVLTGGLDILGIHIPGMLYNIPVIVFGMAYVYLPFMLFPLVLGISLVPVEAREAALDLGASRKQVFAMIDLPLSMPGLVTGCMLTFVLSLGAMAEAKILGGEKVITIAAEIQGAFTYGQNWPLGSALSSLLILITGVLVFFALRNLDFDALLRKKD
jgi:spermidine/putrescine transport system permease protein